MAALRQLLASPVVRRWLAAAVLGQLAWCMAPIAMLAIGNDILGSVATGALLAGLLTLSTALGAPWWGQWMDRHGIVNGLRWAGWCSAAVALAFAGAVVAFPSVPLVGGLAAALGVALAPMPAAFRALLPSLVPSRQLPTASNLDAVALEVALIGGPGLMTGLLLLSDRGGALTLVSVSAMALATATVAAGLPERRPGGGGEPPGAGWRRPVPLGIIGAALLLGLSGGLLETAVFADVDQRGATTAAATGLLTLLGIGSALGGLAGALRPPPVTAFTGGLLLASHGIGTLLAALSRPLWLAAASLFAGGLPIAPVNSVGALGLERHVPAHQRSTSLALAAGALTLGAGSGQLLGGVFIDIAGPQAAFLAAALVPIGLGVGLSAIGVRPTQER